MTVGRQARRDGRMHKRSAPRIGTGWRVAAGLVLALLLLIVGNTLRNFADLPLTQDSAAERRALIAPHWRMLPAGRPVTAARAITLSGCDGVHDNMGWWATMMAQSGRPALILDSHTPRGLDRFEQWRLVCAGQILPGAERAGDLAVALAATGAGDVALLGASHGGWTVLEFLRQLAEETPPAGLSAWPAPPDSLRARVGPVVLLYPYCGLMNQAEAGDWSGLPPILLIAAENDRIVSTPACARLAEDLRALGARVEMVILPGLDHGFDQQERSALSPLVFDARARETARRLVAAFLARADG